MRATEPITSYHMLLAQMSFAEWVAYYEDPLNLRVVIDGKEFPLRGHQVAAVQKLRRCRQNSSVCIDSSSRLWYRPVVTAQMQAAGIVLHPLPIVQKGTMDDRVTPSWRVLGHVSVPSNEHRDHFYHATDETITTISYLYDYSIYLHSFMVANINEVAIEYVLEKEQFIILM